MFKKILNVVYCSQALLLLTLFRHPKSRPFLPKIGVTVNEIFARTVAGRSHACCKGIRREAAYLTSQFRWNGGAYALIMTLSMSLLKKMMISSIAHRRGRALSRNGHVTAVTLRAPAQR